MRMLPDGTVPTCQFNTTPAGSLRETEFATLWKSPQAEKQTLVGARVPRFAGPKCEVLPSAIYTGDLARQTLQDGVRRLPLWHERQ